MKKPTYQKGNTKAFIQLRKEVYSSLGKDFKKRAAPKNEVKALILVVLYLFFVACLWYFNSIGWVFYLLLGILSLPMVLNIGHESVHNNLSDKKWVNHLGRYGYILLGTSGYFWDIRHIYSHHSFANVRSWDLDISQSSLIRLSDSQPYRSFHRFQVYYMPFLFLLYTLIWFFIRDFVDIFRKNFGTNLITSHPPGELILLVIAKTWHILSFIIIPYIISGNLQMAVTGFFIFHITASLMTTLALISTHVGEDQEIVEVGDDGKLPYNWFEHQLNTTADFSTGNRWMLHFFAGFNHHVAHHFFPSIPYNYYPKITKRIKDIASDLGLKYHSYPNLVACTVSHFKRLHRLSYK